MYIGLHVKYPLFLPDVEKVELLRQIFEKKKLSNFIKIRPVEAELFHTDGQSDTTKLIPIFRNFASALKMILVYSI
jgi:hypothetical protein